jgi:Mrp family chromosome partitioning ATPase
MLLLTPADDDEPRRVLHRVTTVAAEVFGPKLDRLIEEARAQFDVIIIEGAPLMLLADSFVIGRQADVVIHVIHWQKTKKSTVANVLQRLQAQAVRVDGTVLARVVPREHRKLGLEDECSHYSDERGFFESLSGRAPPPVLLPEPGASRAA